MGSAAENRAEPAPLHMAKNIFGSSAAPRLGFLPAFGYLAFFSLLPAVATLGISFTDISATPGLPVSWVGFDNYGRLFSPALVGETGNAIAHSLIFALAVSLIQNVLALLVAVLLNRPSRFSIFTRSVVFLPSVLGVTVVGLIWIIFFNPLGGPAQGFLGIFHTSSAFFGDPKVALGLCVFVTIWMSLGYAAIIYTAGLQAVPLELYESAAIDGTSAWQRLRLITVPMIAPSITANMLISIIGSLSAFQLIYVLTGAQNPSTDVLPLMLYRLAFGFHTAQSRQDQGLASAVSIVQFILVGVVASLAYLYFRKREHQL